MAGLTIREFTISTKVTNSSDSSVLINRKHPIKTQVRAPQKNLQSDSYKTYKQLRAGKARSSMCR